MTALNEEEVSELNGQGIIKELIDLFNRENIINNPLFVYEIFWIFINITSYTKRVTIANSLHKRGIVGVVKSLLSKEFMHNDDMITIISEFLRNFANGLKKEQRQIFIDEKIIMLQIEQYMMKYSPKTKLAIIESIVSMINRANTQNTNEERMLYELGVREVNSGFQEMQNKGFVINDEEEYQMFIKFVFTLSNLMENNFNVFVRLNEIQVFNIFAQILLNLKDANHIKVQYSILKVFSSLSTRKNNEYSLFLLRNGLLNLYNELLRNFLYRNNDILMDEILFAISNFESAEDQRNELNLMEFFNNRPFIESLFSLDFKTLLPILKIKYFQCICNLTLTPNTEDIFFLIDQGIIRNFAELFSDIETNYNEQNFIYAIEALIQIYGYTHYTEEQKRILIKIAEETDLLSNVESGVLLMKSNCLIEETEKLENYFNIMKGTAMIVE